MSAYAEEYTDFIRTTRETPDGMTARVERDFGTDFRRYIVRSGLPEYAKGYKLMARAELVAQYLAAAEKPGDLQPVAEEQVAECKAAPASQLKDYSSLKGVTNRLDSLHVRIMTLSGPQLRIVR